MTETLVGIGLGILGLLIMAAIIMHGAKKEPPAAVSKGYRDRRVKK